MLNWANLYVFLVLEHLFKNYISTFDAFSTWSNSMFGIYWPWHHRMYCLMLYDVLEARCCCLPIATAWHYCTISRTVSYIHFYMVIFIKHYIFTFDNKTKGLLVLSAPSDILTCRDLFFYFYFQLHFLFAFCCLFGLRSFDPENGYQCDITT